MTMNQNAYPLSSADLREVSAIIAALEKSRFNYLDMKLGNLHIVVGDRHQTFAPGTEAMAPVVVPSTAPVTVKPAAPVAALAVPFEEAPLGATAVRSPMVGRFYARPEQGAQLYVNVGDRITADTTIGLVEVMKVFNAVSAGVSGVVMGLAVQDGDFVEFDQPLVYVKAD